MRHVSIHKLFRSHFRPSFQARTYDIFFLDYMPTETRPYFVLRQWMQPDCDYSFNDYTQILGNKFPNHVFTHPIPHKVVQTEEETLLFDYWDDTIVSELVLVYMAKDFPIDLRRWVSRDLLPAIDPMKQFERYEEEFIGDF